LGDANWFSCESQHPQDQAREVVAVSGPNSKTQQGLQGYRTPPEFLERVKRRLGVEHFVWDLACTPADCVSEAGGYTHPECDALTEDWSVIKRGAGGAIIWLNPPFAQAGAFARKCAESGATIAALVPVALGTNWWRQYVHERAVVLGVGRVRFNLPDGTPMPTAINRDVALLVYADHPGFVCGLQAGSWYPLEDWSEW
jgi:hypothetical protein